MKKEYIHDCDKCIYLGTEKLDYCYDKNFQVYDLYFCNSTVIARYGNDGQEYISGIIFADIDGHPLKRAKELATKKGLI